MIYYGTTVLSSQRLRVHVGIFGFGCAALSCEPAPISKATKASKSPAGTLEHELIDGVSHEIEVTSGDTSVDQSSVLWLWEWLSRTPRPGPAFGQRKLYFR